jgi:hypothetical protein
MNTFALNTTRFSENPFASSLTKHRHHTVQHPELQALPPVLLSPQGDMVVLRNAASPSPETASGSQPRPLLRQLRATVGQFLSGQYNPYL